MGVGCVVTGSVDGCVVASTDAEPEGSVNSVSGCIVVLTGTEGSVVLLPAPGSKVLLLVQTSVLLSGCKAVSFSCALPDCAQTLSCSCSTIVAVHIAAVNTVR